MANKKENNITGDVSILSSGVKLEGKLYSEGNVRIDGVVNGDVTVNGNLTLGESSKLIGQVKANNITLSGILEGQVVAAEKLVLENRSNLKGDLKARILVIEEGAVFDGNSTMALGPKTNVDLSQDS